MNFRVALFAAGLAVSLAGGLQAQFTGPHNQQQLYGQDFGLSTPIIADGNRITATYLGWEKTTVFGDQIYAMTVDQYTSDLANGCFGFDVSNRADCMGASKSDLGGLMGLDLFGRAYEASCSAVDPAVDPCASPVTKMFGWTDNTEIIFALMVDQSNGDFNWFFSGAPSRNNIADGFDGGDAHLAYFPSAVYPDGVPTYGPGVVPGTAGLDVFGFEDVSYQSSDWDFNNAIFTFDATTISLPESSTPEPATLSLLATGLLGLAAARWRRRRGVSSPA